MPRIVFRGKTYYSVFEMPPAVRRAYEKEQQKAVSKEGNISGAKSLTDLVDMPDEIKDMYERALGRAEENPVSSRPLSELPKTEDIYRQSAPSDMKDKPSDEILYQPSRPVVDPMPPTIEPEEGIGLRGLVWGVIVALILTGLAFVVSRFFL